MAGTRLQHNPVVTVDADADATEAFAQRKATTALILAACGFVLLPVIASVFALIAAHQARGMLRDHPGHPAATQAKAAMVLGWLGLAFGTAALIYAFG